MNTKVLSLALMLTVLFSGISFAQIQRRAQGNMQGRQTCVRGQMADKPMFTEEQKEAMKSIRMEAVKASKPYKDELRELGAKQQTLMTADEPNMNAINKNITKMGELKTELAKIQAKSKTEFRALLTEEQRMMMDSRKGKMKQGQKGRHGKARASRQCPRRAEQPRTQS